jgi:uncharacterized damage-inducible protein DinB
LLDTRDRPEPWLRGPIAGIPPLLQPAAHAFVMAREEADAVRLLAPEELWTRPGGAASAAFHLLHLAGATDRLMTYARGGTLSESQRATLAAETATPPPGVTMDELIAAWHQAVDDALAQLAATPDAVLTEARFVGRARLPSTVIGLLFHAAEHAQRHAGQLVTTVKIITGLRRRR